MFLYTLFLQKKQRVQQLSSSLFCISERAYVRTCACTLSRLAIFLLVAFKVQKLHIFLISQLIKLVKNLFKKEKAIKINLSIKIARLLRQTKP